MNLTLVQPRNLSAEERLAACMDSVAVGCGSSGRIIATPFIAH